MLRQKLKPKAGKAADSVLSAPLLQSEPGTTSTAALTIGHTTTVRKAADVATNDTQQWIGSPEPAADVSFVTDDSAGTVGDAWTHSNQNDGVSKTLSKLRAALSTWDEGRLSDGSARWVVTALVGKGGSGAVFKAPDVRGKKNVAMKVVEPVKSATFSKKQVRQMRREAEAMKQNENENVCGCHDYIFVSQDSKCAKLPEHDCALFVMVLEYLDGKSVRQLMDESPTGRLGEPQTVGVALAMLHGLTRVHEMGLVHKDLKPENVMRVMVDGNPSYKIVGAHIHQIIMRAL